VGQRIVQVDAFTAEPFRGNPAAVCVLEADRPDAWMRAVAREMNLSETAFLRRSGDGWSLRWFTPAVEVDLCGHATLASAHVLWEDGFAGTAEALRFVTRSGELRAKRENGAIVLDVPARAATRNAPPAGLLNALGAADVVDVAYNRMDWLVELRDADAVRGLAPDLTALRRIDARGVIVTARADDGEHDFVSRFFAPAVGVDEDPVTGSAHCCLAPWWAERLGRTELAGYQASARGGTVRVRLRNERVDLIGRAVTVLRGELMEGGLQ
jgi:PhzF family phenazine biosynthesis protein